METNQKPNTDMPEKRSYQFSLEIEKREDEQLVLKGHAAVFNTYADIGWWEERIMPGAFTDTIKKDDVRALYNHDSNYLLGRNKNKTLILREDEQGLYTEITLPDTTYAKDLYKLIERGDVSQMSFGFEVKKQTWAEGDKGKPDKRDIQEVKLYDVSPVVFPAYTQTDISVASRSWESWRDEQNVNLQSPYKANILRRKLNLKLKGGK